MPKKGSAAGGREKHAGRRRRHDEKQKRRRPTVEPVEVFLTEPGEGRPDFEPGVLEYLPPDAPLPQVGDILLLPRASTGDEADAYAWGGAVSPFRVVEREHLYHRDAAGTAGVRVPEPARYLKTLLLVRRVPSDEYYADPGQAVMPVLDTAPASGA